MHFPVAGFFLAALFSGWLRSPGLAPPDFYFVNIFIERNSYGVMCQFFLLDAVLDKYGLTALSSRCTVRKVHHTYLRPTETMRNCIS